MKKQGFIQHKNFYAGFTLIEAIIAISILGSGIIGVYSIFSSFSNVSENLHNKLTASYLAQEGIEIIRNLRENNWVAGNDWLEGIISGQDCSGGCYFEADYKTGTASEITPLRSVGTEYSFLAINSSGFYCYDPGGQETIFKRKIMIKTLGSNSDSIEVLANVFWQKGNQEYSAQISEIMYNWY